MIAIAPDATTMPFSLASSQSTPRFLVVSSDDDVTHLNLGQTDLAVHSYDESFANYWSIALGGRGVSTVDARVHTALQTDPGGVVTTYGLFPEVRHGRQHRFDEIRQAYQPRMDELRAEAQLDAVAWNANSATDFWAFISANPHWRKGLLGLVNNGNLRVTWKGDDGDHLAVQFLGGRSIECVIFKRRHGSRRISRFAGVDTLDALHRLVAAFDLARLVC